MHSLLVVSLWHYLLTALYSYIQIHIILGASDLRQAKNLAQNMRLGAMADVASSANDPIFINHHAMVDCIFEEWLKINGNTEYPDPRKDTIPVGHRKSDYIVPFFPLYKHEDMFKRAENFGYKCSELSDINPTKSGNIHNMDKMHVIPVVLVMAVVTYII